MRGGVIVHDEMDIETARDGGLARARSIPEHQLDPVRPLGPEHIDSSRVRLCCAQHNLIYVSDEIMWPLLFHRSRKVGLNVLKGLRQQCGRPYF